MNVLEANRTIPAYELKDELARLCLPAARRDGNQKLAWANSVCILFLLIGVLGARRGIIAIKPAPPLEEAVPVVTEPVTLPPQTAVQQNERTESEDLNAAPVAVVIPQTPNISFSVPTIGSLVVPANLAVAPPLEPLRPKSQLGTVSSTGVGGERPAPPYPKMAQQAGEQGTVVLLLTGDDAGNVVSVEVKESSGFPMLDRATADFVRGHWRLPAGGGLFQTSVTYQLQF
jgi:TonB family protein